MAKPNNSVRGSSRKKAKPNLDNQFTIKVQKANMQSAVTQGSPPRRVFNTVKSKLKSGW
jgi:hypothetical protein